MTDRGPRPDFTEFEEPSTDSQELQAADLNDHLVEIYCEEFQDILLLSSSTSTSTTDYSTETLLETTISTSTSTTESTSSTTTTTTTTSTTTETVAENLFDPIIYQSESQSFRWVLKKGSDSLSNQEARLIDQSEVIFKTY